MKMQFNVTRVNPGLLLILTNSYNDIKWSQLDKF